MPSHIQVGKLYHPGRRSWPEGGEYNFRDGAHELILRFNSPTAKEVAGIKSGDCEFGLLPFGDVLFLLYRFVGAPWSDAPYSWWLVPEDHRQDPPLATSPETRILLTVILLDARTGIVKVIRAVTLGHAFTLALHDGLRGQAIQDPGRASYDRQLADAYRKWPTTEAMVKDALVKTKGGS